MPGRSVSRIARGTASVAVLYQSIVVSEMQRPAIAAVSFLSDGGMARRIGGLAGGVGRCGGVLSPRSAIRRCCEPRRLRGMLRAHRRADAAGNGKELEERSMFQKLHHVVYRCRDAQETVEF